MRTFSHEDTVLSSQRSDTQAGHRLDEGGNEVDNRMLERCREMFRDWGKRMGSFELSRQIYG